MGILDSILEAMSSYNEQNYRSANAVFIGSHHALSLCLELRVQTGEKIRESDLLPIEYEALKPRLCDLEIHRQEDGQPSPVVCRVEYGKHGERYLY